MNVTYRARSARILSLVLCLVILFLQIPMAVFAEGETRKGVVTANSVNVREDAGTHKSSPPTAQNQNKIIVAVSAGQAVTVLGEKLDCDGDMWYHVSFTKDGTPYDGYIYNSYVAIIPEVDIPVVENKNFEEQLAAFPESYHEAIKALHEAHPSWHFEAVNTDLDWSYVQEKENVLGKSFINDGIISHYSTMAGSYDWETDTYYVQEGSNWYQASAEMIAYYMDPRNFLTANNIFQFEKLAFSSTSQTEENIEAMLKGTFMEGKTVKDAAGNEVSYAKAFLDAAGTYNVSAFHLITRCIQEVGWSGNACSLGTYSGYTGFYNFFNIGAYGGAEDGMKYAKSKGWDSPYKAILAGGEFISSGYIARGQNTPYFQKYNVVEKDVVATHQYMTNIAAAYSEGRIQQSKYTQMGFLETAFTFRIPVYSNMPETPAAMPAAAGSPNNYLKMLAVNGYSLTPTFDFYECLNNGVDSYTLTINGNVPTIVVSAAAVSKTATVTGFVGEIAIVSGENILPITCTAANGEARTFTLRVILNGEGSSGSGVIKPPETVPSGWAPPYKLQGSTVTGLTVGMDVSKFISSLGVYGNATATVTDENGKTVSGGAVRSGWKLHYYDGSKTTEFLLILYGDLNSDSSINGLDFLIMQKYFMEIQTLTSTQSFAADLNKDGKVNGLDLLQMQKYFMELAKITQ